MQRVRISLFVDDPEDSSADFGTVEAWLEKHRDDVMIADYSCGGWEHCWDLEAPLEAATQLPRRLFSASAWANYPFRQDGSTDERWAAHPGDH